MAFAGATLHSGRPSSVVTSYSTTIRSTGRCVPGTTRRREAENTKFHCLPGPKGADHDRSQSSPEKWWLDLSESKAFLSSRASAREKRVINRDVQANFFFIEEHDETFLPEMPS